MPHKRKSTKKLRAGSVIYGHTLINGAYWGSEGIVEKVDRGWNGGVYVKVTRSVHGPDQQGAAGSTIFWPANNVKAKE